MKVPDDYLLILGKVTLTQIDVIDALPWTSSGQRNPKTHWYAGFRRSSSSFPLDRAAMNDILNVHQVPE